MTLVTTMNLEPHCHLRGGVYRDQFLVLADGIYNGRIISDQFCDLILDRVTEYERWVTMAHTNMQIPCIKKPF